MALSAVIAPTPCSRSTTSSPPATPPTALTGCEAFEADGVTYGVPLTRQGIPIYYNKALYAGAELDAEAPPVTWNDLAAACDALIAAGTTCFAAGNKDGPAMEFWLTAMAHGSLTAEEYDAWLAGDRDWTSDNVRRISRPGPTASTTRRRRY